MRQTLIEIDGEIIRRLEALRDSMSRHTAGLKKHLLQAPNRPTSLECPFAFLESILDGSVLADKKDHKLPYEHIAWLFVELDTFQALIDKDQKRVDLIRNFSKDDEFLYRKFADFPNRGEVLRSALRQKNIGSKTLLESMNSIPKGLSHKKLDSVLYGYTRSMLWDHWVQVCEAASKYEARIDLNKSLYGTKMNRIDWLHMQMLEKSITPTELISNIPNCPRGLTQRTIENWLSENSQSADPEYWAAVKKTLKAMPEQTPVRLDDERSGGPTHRAWLKQEMDLRNVKAKALFDGMKDKPEGLNNYQVINAWLSPVKSKVAQRHHWVAVEQEILKQPLCTLLNAGKRLRRLEVLEPVKSTDLKAQMGSHAGRFKPNRMRDIIKGKVQMVKRQELALIFRAARTLGVEMSGAGFKEPEAQQSPPPGLSVLEAA